MVKNYKNYSFLRDKYRVKFSINKQKKQKSELFP